MYTLQILTHIQNSRQVFGFLHFQAQLMDMLGKLLQEITICLSSLKKSHSSGNWPQEVYWHHYLVLLSIFLVSSLLLKSFVNNSRYFTKIPNTVQMEEHVLA